MSERRPSIADASPSRPKFARFTSAGSSEQLTSSPLSSPTLEKVSLSETPPSKRPRAHTNPPLLRRLWMNLFSSASPSPSTSILPSPAPLRNTTSKATPVPKPQLDEESPEGYLAHSKTSAFMTSHVLRSNDMFHVQALRAYISQFDFSKDPLDVALRRLLMDVGLPLETQQIDRVMEAFASRYYQLHPLLFASEDQPYVLAFSLIMLHKDAFNKSNKRKMTKADYIKNTRMPGIAPEVLDCFYDKIVFAPFIFVEDPVDVNGQCGFNADGTRGPNSAGVPGNAGGGSTLLGKGNKVDPYYLISNASALSNLTKVGSLKRMDDVLEGGKKHRTLLFLRDPTWAISFLNQNEVSNDSGSCSQSAIFTPNEVIFKNAMAVYDKSYLKHDHIFRLALGDGRQFLFGTDSESEMNEWISRINYASAFKSTGIQMRPLGMSGLDLQLTGVAAATSHLHDLQINQTRSEWDSETPRDLMEMLSEESESPFKKAPPKRRVTIMSSGSDVDNDVPGAPEIDGDV
ncbi:hypothetical protein EV360DRAFT_87931 [Lentinula raphanica]|nr:hypothetical protein EV360DRAFT_87931 [Lentinula raphanica]